ncbi:hypothetical protein ACJMK2_041728 [Sinanodonta woodiana]|uniref:Uncharacterized protein n=1 Tax=Sinanodonta woodiana TaxID=1069815 RepID=A0ABD3W6Y2_SINWO
MEKIVQELEKVTACLVLFFVTFQQSQSDEKEYLMSTNEGAISLEAGDILPVWRKICFAIGGAPYQMTSTVIGFFISIFLLEVAEIRPYYVAIILICGKIWDAITDPLCGYLVSRTDTRFGKFRPWILFSAPLACGAYFAVWYVPDFSEEEKFAWYFIAYCLFQGFLTGLHVPFTSLTMYISNSQRERDSATAYRMVSEATGVLLAVVIQGQLVNKYRTAGDCSEEATVSSADLQNQKDSYMWGSFVMIGIYLVCSVTVFFGTKEKKAFTGEDHANFFSDLKTVLTFGPYLKLSLSFLFLSLAIQIVQGNLALYCTHTLHLGDQFANFILALLVSAILSMPLWQKCLLKFGKKSVYAAGMMIFIPILISQLYLERNVYAYFVVVILAGLSISVSLLLPWSMLPDVLDMFMLEKGVRKDAIFYAFYVFFNKLSTGVALGISQAVLELGGYKKGECRQAESVGLTLRMLVVPGPVIFVLIALLFLWSYPIDEKRRQQIKKEVMARRVKAERDETGSEHKSPSSQAQDVVFKSDISYESIDVSSTGV